MSYGHHGPKDETDLVSNPHTALTWLHYPSFSLLIEWKRQWCPYQSIVIYIKPLTGRGPSTLLAFDSEVAQSCLTLWDSMDCSLPGSSIHGIFQARILERVAISFSRGSSWPRDQTGVPCTADRLFTLWATREGKHKYSCCFAIKELYRTFTFSEVVIKLNNFMD